MKNGVLKNFAKFTEKYLCRGLSLLTVFIRLQALIQNTWETCNFIKKETHFAFGEFFKNTFFTEHLWTALSALNNLRGDKVSGNIV